MKVEIKKLPDGTRHRILKHHRMKRHLQETFSVIGLDGYHMLQVQFYQTERTTSCCLWLYGKNERSASGKTNMLGGDQRLVALKQALSRAGIVILEGNLGSSTPSMERLFWAIAKHQEPHVVHIIRTVP